VRPHVAHAVRLLRKAGVALSDRRIVKAQRLVASAAALDGREKARADDLWPLVYVLPTSEAQEIGRSVLRPVLAEARNASLGAAALDAASSAAARAERLAASARAALEETPADGERERWTLRLEGLLREIDASFATETLGEDLAALRAKLVASVSGTP
jgi:MoxR-like ATPase